MTYREAFTCRKHHLSEEHFQRQAMPCDRLDVRHSPIAGAIHHQRPPTLVLWARHSEEKNALGVFFGLLSIQAAMQSRTHD